MDGGGIINRGGDSISIGTGLVLPYYAEFTAALPAGVFDNGLASAAGTYAPLSSNVFFTFQAYSLAGSVSRLTFQKVDSASLLPSLTSFAEVPEPATWAMMIAGFGLVGAAARRQRPATKSTMEA